MPSFSEWNSWAIWVQISALLILATFALVPVPQTVRGKKHQNSVCPLHQVLQESLNVSHFTESSFQAEKYIFITSFFQIRKLDLQLVMEDPKMAEADLKQPRSLSHHQEHSCHKSHSVFFRLRLGWGGVVLFFEQLRFEGYLLTGVSYSIIQYLCFISANEIE